MKNKGDERVMPSLVVHLHYDEETGNVRRGPKGELSGWVRSRPDLPGIRSYREPFGPLQAPLEVAVNTVLEKSGATKSEISKLRRQLVLQRVETRLEQLRARLIQGEQ